MDVYCADVGSVSAGNFGWAGLADGETTPYECDDIAALAKAVTERLQGGKKVALGFECPLYVPLHEEPVRLTKARPVDGNRAWSAGAGTTALATGLVEATWLLLKIKENGVRTGCHLSWSVFAEANEGLFLWEAFVSGAAHTDTHSGDAALAVLAFQREARAGFRDAQDETRVFSLIGGALLRARWSSDPALLSQQCIVVKPTTSKYRGGK